jgi:predicted HicB family RNase H-like nuclease
MGAIEDAIAAIESLEPREQFSYRKIAAIYGCSHSALSQRHQGISASCSNKAQNQQALHPQQEQELLRYIKQLTERGLPPTRAMTRRFASDIAKRELGKGWVDRYIKRYDVHLISH